MPLNDQDARALTYLVRRLREETLGAGKWDETGIYAVVSELIGQHLATSIERVVGHATDAEARTPGAIRRPFTPSSKPTSRPLEHLKPEDRCKTCAKSKPDCQRNPHGDHQFEADIFRPRNIDLTPVVAELKGHIEHPTPPQPTHTPGAEVAGRTKESHA